MPSKALHKIIIDPFVKFLNLQEASGYLLLLATVIALVTANFSFGQTLVEFWETTVNINIASSHFHFTIEHFINDGLMTLFFLVVGLEIKRELIEGALSTREQAILPVVGAIGGMIFPACIYLFFNVGTNTDSGWAIPTATDIAFTLAVIQILGNKVPFSLKVFITALAVVDDLGAILVIALFYAGELHLEYFLYTSITVGILLLMNFSNVRSILLYGIVGVFLWFFLHHSGIHATISGVILALCVPLRIENYEHTFWAHFSDLQSYSKLLNEGKRILDRDLRDEIAEKMQKKGALMKSPLSNMLHIFHPFSSYFIMPVFALCNAGVSLSAESLQYLLSPLSLGIFFGLVLGKSLGITLTTYITSKIGITRFPENVKLKDLFFVNILAGIGFTMSMFVSNLAFSNEQFIATARLSIIIASATAGLLGFILNYFKKENTIQ